MIHDSRSIRITTSFFVLISLFTLHSSLFTREAYAVCPICTVAVGAGLGLSRWLGIDDAVSSIWIGGLLMSVSFWSIDWLGKKNFKILRKLSKNRIAALSFIFWYALTIIPLWMGGVIGHPLNTILGIDKIIFGTVLGSLGFLAGVWIDKKVRKIKGKQLFVYQKVVFPTISLVLLSLLIYYYGGYLY
jgi:hypothetical protein